GDLAPLQVGEHVLVEGVLLLFGREGLPPHEEELGAVEADAVAGPEHAGVEVVEVLDVEEERDAALALGAALLRALLEQAAALPRERLALAVERGAPLRVGRDDHEPLGTVDGELDARPRDRLD